MTSPWIERGSPTADVWVIGEAPGEREVLQHQPFIGLSGQELDRMLLEAGWTSPGRLFYTNVAHVRPPSYRDRQGRWVNDDIDQFFPGKQEALRSGATWFRGRWCHEPVVRGIERLETLLARHRPRLLILCGGTALWAVTGREGITKWRGSVLPALGPGTPKTVCTFHPADILRQWPHRVVAVQDFRRALRESAFPELRRPQWDFTLEPTVADIREWLGPFIRDGSPLVCDTEGWGVVDCIGFASSSTRAICIPFLREEGDDGIRNYWSLSDEIEVFGLVHAALTRCPITFHNAVWDLQVIGKNWGFLPRLGGDTMVAQHVSFPGLLGGKIDPITGKVDKAGSSLSLSFIASMYCDIYAYWKDDGRVRDETYTDRQYWAYNCEDCGRTWECQEVLTGIIKAAGLAEQYQFLIDVFGPTLAMMFRGFPIDPDRVQALSDSVKAAAESEQSWLNTALGFPINVNSNPQVQAMFYDDLGVRQILSRKTGRPTADDQALETIRQREPMLLPVVRKIQNLRSLKVNQSSFIAPAIRALRQRRLRTCLNPAGTETFRFSSNETAFGEGGNMQNLTRPLED